MSLDTRLPNQIFQEGLEQGFFRPFRNYRSFKREVTLAQSAQEQPRSRIDFCIDDLNGQSCWVEVKSVTLVEAGCAIFPDAPTARGRRHVEELRGLVTQGSRAAIAFIVQRPDAQSLTPNWTTDPEFAQALIDAAAAGVEIYAYTCNLTLREVCLQQEIPVRLEQSPPSA